MPKIGDRITVGIKGASIGGTALISGFNGFSIEPGVQVQVQGNIVEDLGAYWFVELTMSIGGRNRLMVPKSAQKEP